MRFSRVLLVLILVGPVAACYHATINTDLQPGSTTIDQEWASSWVFGLVPPKTVETASECTNGVARVETEQTFLNGLVGILTFGIYTPIHIKVTCASGGSASLESEGAVEVEAGASPEEIREALSEAAALSKEKGAAVYVVLN